MQAGGEGVGLCDARMHGPGDACSPLSVWDVWGCFFGGKRQFAGAGCVLRSCRKPALCMPPPDPCWRVFFSLQALRLPLGAPAVPAAGALSTIGCVLQPPPLSLGNAPIALSAPVPCRVGCMYAHVRMHLCLQPWGAGLPVCRSYFRSVPVSLAHLYCPDAVLLSAGGYRVVTRVVSNALPAPRTASPV